MATARRPDERIDLPEARGELAGLIATFDWSRTALGPLDQWPQSLRTATALALNSPVAIVLLWGPDGTMIYNDAYAAFAAARHPDQLGMKVREGWPEVADFNDNVMKVGLAGGTLSYRDQELTLFRNGRAEQVWLDLYYSPVPDESGHPAGVMAIVVETTQKVEADRALQSEQFRLRQMYEQSPSFKAMLDGPDHRFVMVNEAYRRLVGQRDVLGQTVAEALPEAAAQGYVDLLDRAFVTGEAVTSTSARFELIRPDGGSDERFVDFVCQPVSDGAGSVSGIFVDGVDVTDRVRAEAVLSASEDQFRTFAQAMPNHVWTARPDGMLDWFNQRVLEYSGLGFDALKDAEWTRLVHADDLERAIADWATALASGTTYETEFRILRHDGEYRWHLIRAVPIQRDGILARWIGTNTDIHEQKLAEVQTMRDRDRLWTLSQDLMLICDYSGTITSVNPSATRMLGYDQDEVVGLPINDFVHPDDIASTAAEVGKLASGATTVAFENRYRCKDGSFKLIDWTAVPDGDRIHAVGRDITEERRLARDRERIWSLSPVVKVVAESSGRVLAVNPSWTSILGWTPEETVGRDVLDFVLPSDLPGASARLAGLAETTASKVDSRSIFVAKDGSEHHFAWTTVPEAGTLYLFGRDVTAEVEAAEALSTTEEALRQSQKMEAVGQLTGGIAHDFNNLLQGITGSLEIVKRRVEQGRLDDLDRFIDGATGAANRAAALTHRLLAFSRRQPLAPRAVQVNPLISSMEDLLDRTIGEGIDLHLGLADDLWLTLCDPNQLENALLNLVINARDAMPNGGKLTIETCNAHLDKAYAASQRDVKPGKYVCICVSDTGTGMDADTIAKAFEPFFTTKPIGQGTGLGLSMIYGFARQSEGYARIYSEIRKGTTFKLYLPRHEGAGAAADDEPARTVASEPSDHGESVLVVEDDPVVRELIVEVLTELGYRPIQAFDGPSGVEMLRSDQRIDLLITDIGLPGLNGRQVADAGRAMRPGLKILFMTGYAENAALASGFLEPGMAMITKPFAIDVLGRRVRAILEG